MNRIILIGNGFDLAHGLKTSYKDFIEWVWRSFILKITSSDKLEYRDDSFFISCKQDKPTGNPVNSLKDAFDNYLNNIHKGIETIEIFDIERMGSNGWLRLIGVSIVFKLTNTFLSKLLEQKRIFNWVDIEDLYYKELMSLSKLNDYKRTDSIKKLNKELDVVKDLLNDYLSAEQVMIKGVPMEQISKYVFSPFRSEDFLKNDVLDSLIITYVESIKNNPSYLNLDKQMFVLEVLPKFISELDIQHYLHWSSNCLQRSSLFNEKLDEIKKDQAEWREIMRYLCNPKDVLLLSFNYTNISENYNIDGLFKVNHIHGELNQKGIENPNPMIFGYGDEISEEYKQLENLNDNTLLENVKSMRYLEADNYRSLMSFIESEEYQIYIMGHSCGISDRTLLNALFEHKNCVSIKPFYYEWIDEEGMKHDNYREIVQNISRNFGDKVMMRNKVVNKTHCLPLPQKC